GHAARQRLALAHRALEDAVQHLEPGFRVAVLMVAEARVARERGLELAGGGAAVAVLGVAIVALLARFEVAVATDGRSARRHHEVALVVTLVARRAVGGSVVALLAGVDNAISTAADAARHAVRGCGERSLRRPGCRAALERADVAARALRATHVALVGRFTGRIAAPRCPRIAGVERRTVRKQRVREGRTAIVLERAQVCRLVEEVAARVTVEGAVRGVHDEVEAPRGEVPVAVGTSVVAQDGVHEDDLALLVVDAGEGVVGDGGIVQRRRSEVREPASGNVRGVAADGEIAQVRGAGVRDAAARRVSDVSAHGAADDLENAYV